MKNNKGITLIALILIFLLVIILGTVLFVVLNNKNENTNIPSNNIYDINEYNYEEDITNEENEIKEEKIEKVEKKESDVKYSSELDTYLEDNSYKLAKINSFKFKDTFCYAYCLEYNNVNENFYNIEIYYDGEDYSKYYSYSRSSMCGSYFNKSS